MTSEFETPDADRTVPEEPVVLEITDVLDLHPFHPSETRDLVRHYLDEAAARGLREVRVIHGRGKGVQRRIIRSLAEKHERVTEFHDAPGPRGGWGATVLTLRIDD